MSQHTQTHTNTPRWFRIALEDEPAKTPANPLIVSIMTRVGRDETLEGRGDGLKVNLLS